MYCLSLVRRTETEALGEEIHIIAGGQFDRTKEEHFTGQVQTLRPSEKQWISKYVSFSVKRKDFLRKTTKIEWRGVQSCILLNYKIVEGIWHNLVWSKANINERFKSKYSLFLTKNSTLKEKIWNYNFTILSIATYKYSWREIFIMVVCSLSWPSLRGLDCV